MLSHHTRHLRGFGHVCPRWLNRGGAAGASRTFTRSIPQVAVDCQLLSGETETDRDTDGGLEETMNY